MVKTKDTLAEAVMRARVAKLWTQAVLAVESGLSPSLIADIERGETKSILPLTAAKLGTALEINLKMWESK